MIFLGHSSEDKARVTRIADALKAAGIDVWLDTDRVAPGDNFVLKISEALGRSRHILVFLSTAFLQSEWVKSEWSTLFMRRVSDASTRVISVLISNLPDDLPPSLALLRTSQYVDLRDPEDVVPLRRLTEFLVADIRQNALDGSGPERTGDETLSVTVRPTYGPDRTLVVRYEVGEESLTSQVDLDSLTPLIQASRTNHIRVAHRFGDDPAKATEAIARRAFAPLLPALVREHLRDNRIRRLQVLADRCDPCLPWELVHDGDKFVGPHVPIVTTPLVLANPGLSTKLFPKVCRSTEKCS